MTRPRRGRVAVWLDSHWPTVMLGAFVLFFLAYGGASLLVKTPFALEAVPRAERLRLYASVAGAVGPLLGFAVASIALLVALTPERAAVEHLEGLAAWKILPKLLLLAAGCLALTLILSILAQSADASTPPDRFFQAVMVAVTATSLLGLAVGGAAFGLVVQRLHQG